MHKNFQNIIAFTDKSLKLRKSCLNLILDISFYIIRYANKDFKLSDFTLGELLSTNGKWLE